MKTSMQASSMTVSPWQRTEQLVLSVPVQATLYTGLCSLIVWLVFFSAYPAAHNTTHSLRHHTMNVSCH